MNPQTRHPFLWLTTLAFLAGAGLTWFVRPPAHEAANSADAKAPAAERKILYWHDPMVPGFKSDKPGKSPFMDMELVPVYEDEAAGDAGVSVAPGARGSLGVATVSVETRRLEPRIEALGHVADVAGNEARLVAEVFASDASWLRDGAIRQTRAVIVGRDSRKQSGQLVATRPDVAGGRVIVIEVHAKVQGLAPGDTVPLELRGPPGPPMLAVPRDAVIRTAQRTTVIQALGEGRFASVPVEIVGQDETHIAIRGPIAAGTKVVTRAQFLFDAEASITGSLGRMDGHP